MGPLYNGDSIYVYLNVSGPYLYIYIYKGRLGAGEGRVAKGEHLYTGPRYRARMHAASVYGDPIYWCSIYSAPKYAALHI